LKALLCQLDVFPTAYGYMVSGGKGIDNSGTPGSFFRWFLKGLPNQPCERNDRDQSCVVKFFALVVNFGGQNAARRVRRNRLANSHFGQIIEELFPALQADDVGLSWVISPFSEWGDRSGSSLMRTAE